MWKCHKCGKPVYFAERKQSIGFDWHPECLRCEECGKRLNPGQHAEHKGVPYCHIPCYSVLFGPTLFGHGSQVEAHTSFGKMEKKLPPGVDRAILESKLKTYNQYYEGNSGQLKWKERNGKLILEGVLRIHWGVNNLIHLKENEDQRHHVQVRKRYSYRDPQSRRRSQNVESGVVQNSQVNEKVLCSDQIASHDHQSIKDDSVNGGNMGISNAEDSREHDCINGSAGEVISDFPVNEILVGESDSKVNCNGNEDKASKTRTMEVDNCVSTELVGSASSEVLSCSTEIREQNNLICASSDVLRYDTINEPEEPIAQSESASKTVSGEVPNGVQTNRDIVQDLQLSDDDDDIEEANKPKRERINVSRVQIRKLTSSRSKTKLRRRCSINGHYYNRETKTFTPPHGSATNVWVTSMVNTSEVINLLLDKFCVENSPEDFALFVVRDNGEIRMIKEEEYPLLARVLLGPHEDVVKVFIMDKKQTDEISNEVAQYLNFQEPELNAIMHKFYEEENREVKKIKLKYAEMRRRIRAKLATMNATQSSQK